ncbi:hemin uptake protein HemP [Rhodoferax sp.]|uniref:hemin uptake protein HemP n=1 Tax=Rhodoferax sp. TaxID=50421 RepID=UPI00262840D8|nr:hemin uptake protein HemP [Rhodoferax sp.]MDD3937922.1 hemin uptake protein HemP [Rhodoferax sp.]
MNARTSSDHGMPSDLERIRQPGLPTSQTNPSEPWVDSKNLLGDQGVVLIRHEGLTYRLQATRFGKLLLTK